MSIEQLTAQALDLPIEERSALAKTLLESLDPLHEDFLEGETEEEVERAWEIEIKRRIEEIDNGTVTCLPWEEVKERIEAKRLANR